MKDKYRNNKGYKDNIPNHFNLPTLHYPHLYYSKVGAINKIQKLKTKYPNINYKLNRLINGTGIPCQYFIT